MKANYDFLKLYNKTTEHINKLIEIAEKYKELLPLIEGKNRRE